MEGLEILIWGAAAVPIVSAMLAISGSWSTKRRVKKTPSPNGQVVTFRVSRSSQERRRQTASTPKEAANFKPDVSTQVNFHRFEVGGDPGTNLLGKQKPSSKI